MVMTTTYKDLVYNSETVLEKSILPMFDDRNEYYTTEDFCTEDVAAVTEVLIDFMWEFTYEF
jgi:hypothetical protein